LADSYVNSSKWPLCPNCAGMTIPFPLSLETQNR